MLTEAEREGGSQFDPKPTLNGNTRPEALVEIEADIVGWIARSLRLGVLADFLSWTRKMRQVAKVEPCP
jgi:hypothetical protein